MSYDLLKDLSMASLSENFPNFSLASAGVAEKLPVEQTSEVHGSFVDPSSFVDLIK